jgi:hypothetical protein
MHLSLFINTVCILFSHRNTQENKWDVAFFLWSELVHWPA